MDLEVLYGGCFVFDRLQSGQSFTQAKPQPHRGCANCDWTALASITGNINTSGLA